MCKNKHLGALYPPPTFGWPKKDVPTIKTQGPWVPALWLNRFGQGSPQQKYWRGCCFQALVWALSLGSG